MPRKCTVCTNKKRSEIDRAMNAPSPGTSMGQCRVGRERDGRFVVYDDLRTAQARDETSDQGDQPPLGVRAALYVALGGLQ